MAGGLVSLGPDLLAMAGPAAAQIDKIIKGTSPADIRVEQPTQYELYINLETARLLNVTDTADTARGRRRGDRVRRR